MLNHRKTPGRSGRRSIKGGAMFAALALAFSASAIFGTGAASAQRQQGPHDATCQSGGENEIDVQGLHERHCFTVDTTVQPVSDFPLGSPSTTTSTVTKTRKQQQTVRVQTPASAASRSFRPRA